MDFLKPNTVVIFDNQKKQWLCFNSPKQIIQTSKISGVTSALQKVEAIVNSQGVFAAGFVGFDASTAFDDALCVKQGNSKFPLVWFGLYEKPRRFHFPDIKTIEHCENYTWKPSIDFTGYKKKIALIKEYIAAGITYQVNYTFNLKTRIKNCPWNFFKKLVCNQNSPYSAFLHIGSHSICCASPELFFNLENNTLFCKPMKGTAQRGQTLKSDMLQKEWLQNSEKNKAENVMIVDMVRNDMGKIATNATVHVPTLFACEKYPTVWQMTSSVECTTKATVSAIFGALFPCASITGAPKVSTMEIIKNMESDARGLYTGSIGFIAPKRRAQFNVAIRTVVIDNKTKSASYGVGGGIVWQSDAKEEHEECRIKAGVLAKSTPDFSLLETMLYSCKSGIYLAEMHLKRLAGSAQYFDFPCNIQTIAEELTAYCSKFKKPLYRVRLLLDKSGSVRMEANELGPLKKIAALRLALAPEPIDSSDRFLYHKTTNRAVHERAAHTRPGFDDVLLYNEKGLVTETTTANIVIKTKDGLITPQLSCGLLPGTMRQHVLSRGKIKEGTVTISDLKKSKEIYCINSVRKWRPAIFVED